MTSRVRALARTVAFAVGARRAVPVHGAVPVPAPQGRIPQRSFPLSRRRGADPVRRVAHQGFPGPGPAADVRRLGAGAGAAGRTLFAEAVLVALAFALAAVLTAAAVRELTGSRVLALLAAVLEVAIVPRTYGYPKLLVYAAGFFLLQRYVTRPTTGRLFAVAAAIVGGIPVSPRPRHLPGNRRSARRLAGRGTRTRTGRSAPGGDAGRDDRTAGGSVPGLRAGLRRRVVLHSDRTRIPRRRVGASDARLACSVRRPSRTRPCCSTSTGRSRSSRRCCFSPIGVETMPGRSSPGWRRSLRSRFW